MAKKYLIILTAVLLLALSTASFTLASDKEPGDLAVSDAGLAFSPTAPEALWPGPDGFGYIGSTPAYSWVEISATGTPVILADDGYGGPFPIGFT
jgi:hypothetical protein